MDPSAEPMRVVSEVTCVAGVVVVVVVVMVSLILALVLYYSFDMSGPGLSKKGFLEEPLELQFKLDNMLKLQRACKSPPLIHFAPVASRSDAAYLVEVLQVLLHVKAQWGGSSLM